MRLTIKKIIIVLFFLVFIISLVRQGVAMNKIKNDLATKSRELEELVEKNKRLKVELEEAETNYDYLEKLARERLGLIKEGEQVISSLKPQE
jgi:cell division protein FtsB